ncbi:hypothetical protein [Streptomyces sp. GESEQ-35]|uniref:hypothetical protein n=1 Tax=Streptomyces sp. GESEQ-35 TaxID=2812657 RepID=UPI001B330B58|nr:hypothetical protein [Streptomyces sp. GESEQ-35]
MADPRRLPARGRRSLRGVAARHPPPDRDQPRQTESQPATVPFGITLRRLEPADTDALEDLDPDASWLSASWGGPLGLAASGHGWAALSRKGRVLAVACTYLLALACVNALCEDIAARNRTPGWNYAVLNRAGPLLAWTAGCRLVREYVHYAVGSPISHDRLSARGA